MRKFCVFLNGEEQKINTAKIYPVPYNSTKFQEFVICDYTNNAVFEIKTDDVIRDVVIRPLSAEVKFEYDEHTVKVYPTRELNFSVEINSSIEDNLLIFSSPDKKYDLDGYNIIHIKEDTCMDRLLIDEDNTALVIDEGVTLNARVEVNGCRNIKICGKGIITQSGKDDIKYRICLDLLGCENVSVEDITITESLFWCFRVFGCDNVHINNIKIIGYRGNNDGIDVCGSRNVTVDGAFIRTWDDSFVVKAVDERDKKSVHYVVKDSPTDMTKAFERVGDVYNILFKNSTLWNDFARPIEIGVSLRADKVHDIRYENIDIIHSTTGYPLMGAHHGDRAEVYNVTFSDIRIEDAPGAQMFDFRITDSEWSTDDRKGCMHDFLFKNIKLVGKPGISILPENSRLEGYSEENGIKNFRFENIELLGRAVKNADECGLDIKKHVENIEFVSDSDKKEVSIIKSGLVQVGDAALRSDGQFDVEVSLVLENKSEEAAKGEVYIKASPKNSGEISAKTAFSLKPGERKDYNFKGVFPPGKHILGVESKEIGVKTSRILLDLPWCVSDDISKANAMYFTNYYGDSRPPVYMSVKDGVLTLKSELIKNGSLILYTANPVPVCNGEVLFTVEETDFGESAALVMGEEGPVSAPQLRCPAEITYVFHNEPKVEKINKIVIPKAENGIFSAGFSELGIKSAEFLAELQVEDEECKKYRYAYTLGHSVWPKSLSHMFIKVKNIR